MLGYKIYLFFGFIVELFTDNAPIINKTHATNVHAKHRLKKKMILTPFILRYAAIYVGTKYVIAANKYNNNSKILMLHLCYRH